MKTLKFHELNLSPEILKAIKDMGFEETTPIQSQAISIIKEGKDVLGQSQTGTGKTAAFGIPCLENINTEDKSLQALILCPTRELAIQVSEEFRKLLKYKNDIRTLPIYGGQSIDRQIMALKKSPQVVIGTPGRIMDHMRRRTLKTETIKMIILDEADEMLDMGFREDIETILKKVPKNIQTILFSATMPKGILEITKNYQKEPVNIKVMRRELTVPNIYQAYFEVKEYNKLEALCRIMDMQNPSLSIVFCNTKKRVDELVEHLQGRGYFAEGLHGDLKQQQRDIVMKKFRNKTLEILVATDVAARGIDVENIDVVFNYDLPQDEEYYIHRIGRTGRAGRSGKAYTFVVGREIYKLKDIMKYTKRKIEREKLPTANDIEEIRTKNFIDEIKATIEEGHLTKYLSIIDSMIIEDYNCLDIASALMKIHLYNKNDDLYNLDDNLFSNKNKKFKPTYEKKPYSKNNMSRLFLNVGKNQKIFAKDIVGAITNESNIKGSVIGNIDIYDDFSFVDIESEYIKDVLTNMKNTKIKGIKINIEHSKKYRDKK